jgi:hypothetical protein
MLRRTLRRTPRRMLYRCTYSMQVSEWPHFPNQVPDLPFSSVHLWRQETRLHYPWFVLQGRICSHTILIRHKMANASNRRQENGRGRFSVYRGCNNLPSLFPHLPNSSRKQQTHRTDAKEIGSGRSVYAVVATIFPVCSHTFPSRKRISQTPRNREQVSSVRTVHGSAISDQRSDRKASNKCKMKLCITV